MSFGWLFVLMVLATYRVTRLITEDSFPPAYWLRERIVLGTADTRWQSVGELWQCPWCMSVWAGGAVTLTVDVYAGVPLPLLVWAGVAAVAPLMSTVENAMKER